MQEHCRHELTGNFVAIPLEIQGDLYDYVSRISNACGYTMEVVLGVLVAIGMERDPVYQKMKAEAAAKKAKKKKRKSKARS